MFNIDILLLSITSWRLTGSMKVAPQMFNISNYSRQTLR
jgi:hypothetical protein